MDCFLLIVNACFTNYFGGKLFSNEAMNVIVHYLELLAELRLSNSLLFEITVGYTELLSFVSEMWITLRGLIINDR